MDDEVVESNEGHQEESWIEETGEASAQEENT